MYMLCNRRTQNQAFRCHKTRLKNVKEAKYLGNVNSRGFRVRQEGQLHCPFFFFGEQVGLSRHAGLAISAFRNSGNPTKATKIFNPPLIVTKQQQEYLTLQAVIQVQEIIGLLQKYTIYFKLTVPLGTTVCCLSKSYFCWLHIFAYCS